MAMAPGASPAIVTLGAKISGYQIAFQGDNGHSWATDVVGRFGTSDTGIDMQNGASPDIIDFVGLRNDRCTWAWFTRLWLRTRVCFRRARRRTPIWAWAPRPGPARRTDAAPLLTERFRMAARPSGGSRSSCRHSAQGARASIRLRMAVRSTFRCTVLLRKGRSWRGRWSCTAGGRRQSLHATFEAVSVVVEVSAHNLAIPFGCACCSAEATALAPSTGVPRQNAVAPGAPCRLRLDRP
jgi:hypothetical protein